MSKMSAIFLELCLLILFCILPCTVTDNWASTDRNATLACTSTGMHYGWVRGLPQTITVCIIQHAGVGTCAKSSTLPVYTSNGFLLTISLYFPSFCMHFRLRTGANGLERVWGSLQTNRTKLALYCQAFDDYMFLHLNWGTVAALGGTEMIDFA